MSAVPSNEFVRLTIAQALADLPALPNVVGRVLQETENPSASAVSIEKLIAADQALASKVLRVVNSAYYGLSGQITSLGQAIVILGMQQIRNLVLSVGAMGAIQAKTPRQQEVLKEFWMHSLAAAAVCSLVCHKKRLPPKDAESLFVAALLHDIGRLFIFCTLTSTYDQVIAFAAEKGITVEAAEVQLLGADHGAFGEQMATQWHLPDALAKLIGSHEGPFGDEATSLDYVLHYSDQLTKYLYFPSGVQPISVIDPAATAWIAFTAQEEEWLKDEIGRKLEEASALFGLLAA